MALLIQAIMYTIRKNGLQQSDQRTESLPCWLGVKKYIIASDSFIGKKIECTIFARSGSLTSFVQLSAFCILVHSIKSMYYSPFKALSRSWVAFPFNLRNFKHNSLQANNDLALGNGRRGHFWLFSFNLLLVYCKAVWLICIYFSSPNVHLCSVVCIE